ncbi:MAG: hypothetical protein E6K18_07760 [Methanobacteriota archaeon]|nr:MAG: hypothetical protein E6K18_07760 [Euryarchaeota archaeon]
MSPESTPSGRLGAPLAGGPPFDLNPGENRTVIWPIDTTGLAPLSTVSARVLSVVTNGSYLFENEPARAYVGAASPNKNIDGLFQDWAGATADSDLSPVRRASLDIKNSDGSVVGSDVYLYMKFGGTPLEGTPAPRRQARQQAPGGGGGGTSGSGTPPGRLVGYDYIRFFLRTDDTASGGIDVNGLLVDRYVELRGRERQVRSAAVYRWTGSSWQWEAPLTWAFGDVEVEVRASLPNATFRSSQIVGMTVDWMGVVDSASAQPTRAATRGAHGPVVLDISGQWYLRDTPPSDQMGCTVNRKAERTQGSSNKSVTLTGNESACWDVDDTSGQTVPAGDWQSVLDIYSSSPSDTTYNVIFQIWDKTNHQVVTTIGSCTGVSNYGNDQTCTIYSVGSQTIASDQVVRLRVERAGGGGTVRIDYDSGTSAGDSRLFLAIPEFHDVAFPVTLGATAVLAIAWMRRRKPAS